jgi:nitrile hydratase accessory protein
LNRDRQEVFRPLATQDNDAPFAEPWQAQVMALAFAASQKGIFSPAQWSEALGAELRKNGVSGAIDDRTSYYQAALLALETLLHTGGSLTQETVMRREMEWRRAYLNTPHGMPIELSAGADI